MDPITFWTAVGSITMVLTITGAAANYIRTGDKAHYDNELSHLNREMNNITTQIIAKASKDEMDKAVLRLEKDIQTVRTEQKTGHAEIRQDLKELRLEMMANRNEVMQAIRDIRE